MHSSPEPQRLVFKISGMDCAEEVAILKREIGPLVGDPERLGFDILNAKMTVSLGPEDPSQDPSQDQPEKRSENQPKDKNGDRNEEGIDASRLEALIVQAVAKTGMAAIPWPGDGAPGGEAEFRFWERRGRSVMCAASGLLVGAGVASHAMAHGGLLDAVTSGGGDPQHAYPILSVLLLIAGSLCGAWFVLPKAWLAVKRLRPDMNLLMTIAIAGAMLIGEWFEAGAVSFLFSFALLLESWSVGRARNAIRSLVDSTPTIARYRPVEGAEPIEADVAEVPLGATVLVRPGEKVPLDGVILKGETSLDESPITGESLPVEKAPGAEIFAGTINIDGAIEFRATKAAADTTLARIIRMVEEAQSRRAPSEQWVERFAFYYTPAMMGLAFLVAVVPPLFAGGEWSHWFYQALVLLVIACPCALVISTPVSIVAALATAARSGVLIKGGAYLEAPARLSAIAFDKTGTLTYGKPVVQKIIALNGHSETELLERAAALEAHSTHPFARAVLRRARDLGIDVEPAESFQIVQGKGALGVFEGRKFWIGSHRFVEDLGVEDEAFHELAVGLEDAGHSLVAVGNEDHICGVMCLADAVRPAAAGVVADLKACGLAEVVMLTGDNEGTASAVAKATGVDRYWSQLLPEDKVSLVGELQRQHGAVAMVGDGINDAPALATATLGIAMGAAGSDAAIETADIALMSDDLTRLPWLIRHSRRTLRTIHQNVVFSLGLKAVFIVMAIFGVATLWMAIAADMGASLIVIFNSLRLLRDEA